MALGLHRFAAFATKNCVAPLLRAHEPGILVTLPFLAAATLEFVKAILAYSCGTFLSITFAAGTALPRFPVAALSTKPLLLKPYGLALSTALPLSAILANVAPATRTHPNVWIRFGWITTSRARRTVAKGTLGTKLSAPSQANQFGTAHARV